MSVQINPLISEAEPSWKKSSEILNGVTKHVFLVPVTRGNLLHIYIIYFSKDQCSLPELPQGGTKSNNAKTHTIVIKAMCDLMTDYHADAAIVERLSLAFAEKRRLKDSSRKH